MTMDVLLFNQTRQNILDGTTNHSFVALIDWVKKTFKIDVYHVVYGEVGNDRTPWLNFILKTTKDAEIFEKKVGLNNNSKATEFFKAHYSTTTKYKTENVCVECESFENACLVQLSESTAELKKNIADTSQEIWLIQQMNLNFIIFTHKKAQVKSIQNFGSEFQLQIFKQLKSKDEFDFLTIENIRMHFDSKENFDKKHGGSWRSYFG